MFIYVYEENNETQKKYTLKMLAVYTIANNHKDLDHIQTS